MWPLTLILAIFGIILATTGYNANTSGPMVLGVSAILVGILLAICFRNTNDDMLTILNPEPKE